MNQIHLPNLPKDLEFKLDLKPFQKKEPTFFEKLWRKVCLFIKKLWRSLPFHRTPKITLTDKSVDIINTAIKNRRKFDYAYQTLDDVKPIPYETITLSQSHDSPYVPDDNVLKKLIKLGDDAAETVLMKCIYPNSIQPKIENLKTLSQGTLKGLKPTVTLIYNILQDAKPFLETIERLKDPATTISIQLLLQILLEEEGGESNLKTNIKETLTAKVEQWRQKRKISKDQYLSLQKSIEPLFDFLSHSSKWINTSHPQQFQHFIFDAFSFVETAGKNIKDGDLDNYIKELTTIFDADFDETIQEALKSNIRPITHFITERLAELIGHMPFSSSYDKILNLVNQHAAAWIEASQFQDKVEKDLQTVRRNVDIKPETEKEVVIQQKSEEVLKELKREGKEKYLNNRLLWKYSKDPVCDKGVKKIIRSLHPKTIESETHKLFQKLAEKLFTVIFPPETIHLHENKKIKISGLVNLFDKIKPTDKLSNILDTFKKFFNKVCDESTLQNRKNFENYCDVLSKFTVTEILKKQVTKQIAENLENLIVLFSKPKFLEELFASNLIPLITDLTLYGWGWAASRRHLDKMAPLLKNVAENQNKKSAEKVTATLYQLVKGESGDFKFDDNGVTQEKFHTLMLPLITEINNNLLRPLMKSNKQLSMEQVKKALSEYFNSTPKGIKTNPVYGELIKKLVFNVGDGIGGTFATWAFSLGKGAISTACSTALHEFSSSYHRLLLSCLTLAEKHLLDPEKLNHYLYKHPLPKDATKQKIVKTKQINDVFSALGAVSHDSIYQTIRESQGRIAAWAACPKTDKLTHLFSNINRKLLKIPKLNMNLLIKFTNIVIESLENASKETISGKKVKATVKKLNS